MKHILKFLLLALLFPATAHADLKVRLDRGKVEPMPISISPFSTAPGGDTTYARQIPEIITKNLEGSGLFRAVNPQAFVQNADSVQTDGPRFSEWRAAAGQALVTGHVTKGSDGAARVEFRLWDVFGEKLLTGTAYTTTPDNWRRIAHIISDQIYKNLTGEDGYFDSRIVYIAESGSYTKRIKRLAIMDQDGANHKYLTDGRTIVLTPRFSPTEQKITYMEFTNRGAKVYLYDLATGNRQILGNFQGLTFAPRFSPDGKKVIMSQAIGGNTDIYELDLRSNRKRRLTENAAIDTAPSYSPDGNQITFESDRGGTQQIYVMDIGSQTPKRITFGDGRYANPVWSPRGDLIAFTRMYKGKFYIGVIRPDGSGERLITTAYHVEGPSWSPNGRVLTYFKEQVTGGGNSRQANIYTVDITGFNERILKTLQGGSDPAWSPLN